MGIKHHIDLSVTALNHLKTNFNEYVVTEKLDGSNLCFGIDECGFFTSRELKGGSRIYHVGQLPLMFSTTYHRHAHIALEAAASMLISDGVITAGDLIECEILMGELPNVVRYDGANRVVFLRTVYGTANIFDVASCLSGFSVEVTVSEPSSPDGISVALNDITRNWSFHSNSPLANTFSYDTFSLSDFQSNFGAYWIEGVVLSHHDGYLTKVVDTEYFTRVKNFNWKVRDELRRPVRSLGNNKSLLGEYKCAIGRMLGNESLGTIYYKKHLSDNTLISSSEMRHLALDITDRFIDELGDKRSEYKESRSQQALDVFIRGEKHGFVICDEIHQRNMNSFYDAWKYLTVMKEKINGVNDHRELMGIVHNKT